MTGISTRGKTTIRLTRSKSAIFYFFFKVCTVESILRYRPVDPSDVNLLRFRFPIFHRSRFLFFFLPSFSHISMSTKSKAQPRRILDLFFFTFLILLGFFLPLKLIDGHPSPAHPDPRRKFLLFLCPGRSHGSVFFGQYFLPARQSESLYDDDCVVFFPLHAPLPWSRRQRSRADGTQPPDPPRSGPFSGVFLLESNKNKFAKPFAFDDFQVREMQVPSLLLKINWNECLFST